MQTSNRLDSKAELVEIDAALESARASTKEFGRVFSTTISSAIVKGKSFEDTLRTIALRISSMALKKALGPLEDMLGGLMGSFGPGSGGVKPFAKGGAFSTSGNLINSPTLFSSNGGLGVMGEAGPEAILPLSKGADGRLGVTTRGGGSGVQIVFNVQTPNAETFGKSEPQLSAMLARSVQRAQRNM